MARVMLLSDIHFECMDNKGITQFFHSLEEEKVDLVVLSGDICNYALMPKIFGEFSKKYAKSEIVYVPGNHEYYGHTPEDVDARIASVSQEFDNFTCLNNARVIRCGLTIGGSTLWFPEPGVVGSLDKKYMADFHHIKEFEPWVYEQNKKSVDFLQEHVGRCDIVFTHHMPSPRLIAKEYKESNINQFFYTDLTGLIFSEGPKYWFFGHTHKKMTQKIGNTTLISNPYGYPHETRNVLRQLSPIAKIITVG